MTESLFPVPEPLPKERRIDEIWDALEGAFGPVRTRSERGRRNNAVRELREAEATPEEIGIAVDFCRRNFSAFTEKAVCAWLSRALHESQKAGTRKNFLELLERRAR